METKMDHLLSRIPDLGFVGTVLLCGAWLMQSTTALPDVHMTLDRLVAVIVALVSLGLQVRKHFRDDRFKTELHDLERRFNEARAGRTEELDALRAELAALKAEYKEAE